MRVFFSVGEPSGDVHGANMVRELRRRSSTVSCEGFGGPKMAAAGCQLEADLTELAIMGLFRVLWFIPSFLRLLGQADKVFRERRPDLVVLIDYPGFNWWVARRARRYGIPVIYYGAPQMWAWAGWRIHKMRRLVDRVLCKLPFEAAWYQQRGVRAEYVGHPFFDDTHQRQLDEEFLRRLTSSSALPSVCHASESGSRGDHRPAHVGSASPATKQNPATKQSSDIRQPGGSPPLVTILPGSRVQEVVSNLPVFLRTVERVHASVPTARFAIASFNERQGKMARECLAEYQAQHPGIQLPIEVYVGRTPELIAAAHCCLACSGSVSLELLHYLKPTVIHYRIQRLGMVVQAFFRRVKYITLVNLLSTSDIYAGWEAVYDPDAPGAEPVPFPEYLTSVDRSPQMARHLIGWLTDEPSYRERVEWLTRLRGLYGAPGATARAAEVLWAELLASEKSTHAPRRAA